LLNDVFLCPNETCIKAIVSPKATEVKKETCQEGSSESSMKSENAQTEIARLKRELYEAQVRAEAYDEMINIAEERFKISIRKKSGAKR
jgi:F0F1-type ATP synthase membrane subunit b/b'